MSATLMRPGRPTFEALDRSERTATVRLAAADGYFNYGGTYTVQPGKVVHHIKFSLFAKDIGTDLQRSLEWQGKRLVLSAPISSVDGKPRFRRLVWERATAAAE